MRCCTLRVGPGWVIAVDIVEAWRKSRIGRCGCKQCFYCDRQLDVHQHDHYPVPKRAGGTNVVAACLVCHDLKDRIPLHSWDVDAMHAAFDELFLEKVNSMRHLPKERVLACLNSSLSDLDWNWVLLSPLARVLLAKLHCSYQDSIYLHRLESESHKSLSLFPKVSRGVSSQQLTKAPRGWVRYQAAPRPEGDGRGAVLRCGGLAQDVGRGNDDHDLPGFKVPEHFCEPDIPGLEEH
jgi:hypothetical protein